MIGATFNGIDLDDAVANAIANQQEPAEYLEELLERRGYDVRRRGVLNQNDFSDWHIVRRDAS